MIRTKFDCVIIGDVMFDVFLRARDALGHFVPNGTSYCDMAKIDFGGAGNVASALSLLGNKVSFIGKAGHDSWGRLYKRNLLSREIATAISFEKKMLTGVTLALISSSGERSFCVFRGANDQLSERDIDNSRDLLRNSKYMYFSGYSLVSNPQRSAILHAIKLTKRYGVRVFFDPGAHNLIEANYKLFTELLDTCDVFCPNIDEARAITKSGKLEEAILKLQKTGKLIGLKCGPDGCILIRDKQCVKVPGLEVDCVDTTGAGDAFAAALICGLVSNLSLYSAGTLANWLAAQVTTGIGARKFPLKSEVFKFQKGLRC